MESVNGGGAWGSGDIFNEKLKTYIKFELQLDLGYSATSYPDISII